LPEGEILQQNSRRFLQKLGVVEMRKGVQLIPYESGNEMVMDAPSNYTKDKKWFDRLQYANILRDLISTQLTQYKRETNRIKKTRISQNIAYLLQVMNSMIKDEKDIDVRLERLEELAGIAKKGKITR